MNGAQTPKDSPYQTHDIRIGGMTCDHCARRVEKALRGRPGVKEVAVDLAAARARVTFEPNQVDIATLHQAILASGYKPEP
jgi:Cu+-exporting ATPase